jgi:putative ABC transport system permease protein
VSDYHHHSLKEKFKPTIFYIQLVYANYYVLSLENSADTQRIITSAKEIWSIFYPNDPFEYFFLSDFYNAQYRDDNRLQRVFTSLTILAVFIACSGLFALSLFTIAKRSKEIAIRKVVGASVTDIVITILGDFLRLVLVALIMGIPIAFIVLSKWLENYSNRISLGFWLAWMPFAMIVVITISIVVYQTITAARANSVKYLKYE